MSTQTELPELTRQFGGKLDNFESKIERAFEQKHLKNYLKGAQFFKHGFKSTQDGVRVPAWYQVLEKWV